VALSALSTKRTELSEFVLSSEAGVDGVDGFGGFKFSGRSGGRYEGFDEVKVGKIDDGGRHE
jgi:hypothetical protein